MRVSPLDCVGVYEECSAVPSLTVVRGVDDEGREVVTEDVGGCLHSTVTVSVAHRVLLRVQHRCIHSAVLCRFDYGSHRAEKAAPILCVYHSCELQDAQGRYEVGEACCQCTAYNTRSMQRTQFSIQGIVPARVVAIRSGVLVMGKSSSISRVSISHDDDVYLPVCDAWFMCSPLSITPVYVDATLNSPSIECSVMADFTSHGRHFVIAQTRKGGICLAAITLLEARGVLLWSWMGSETDIGLNPSQCCPPLSSHDASVCIPVDPTGAAHRQVFYVYCNKCVEVLQTPELDSASKSITAGGCIKLFSLRSACRPILLPVHASVAPLVAVFSPDGNALSLLDAEGVRDHAGKSECAGFPQVPFRDALLQVDEKASNVVSCWGPHSLIQTSHNRILHVVAPHSAG